MEIVNAHTQEVMHIIKTDDEDYVLKAIKNYEQMKDNRLIKEEDKLAYLIKDAVVYEGKYLSNRKFEVGKDTVYKIYLDINRSKMQFPSVIYTN